MKRNSILSLSLASLVVMGAGALTSSYAEDVKDLTKDAMKEANKATGAALKQAEATAAATGTPFAGTTLKGVDISILGTAVTGWSVKDKILDTKVDNESKDKVGEIKDIIISPDKMVTYAIVEVGGFLGMGERKVAIETQYFKMDGDKIILEGATKDLLKSLPEFQYAK